MQKEDELLGHLVAFLHVKGGPSVVGRWGDLIKSTRHSLALPAGLTLSQSQTSGFPLCVPPLTFNK